MDIYFYAAKIRFMNKSFSGRFYNYRVFNFGAAFNIPSISLASTVCTIGNP